MKLQSPALQARKPQLIEQLKIFSRVTFVAHGITIYFNGAAAQ